MTRRSMKRRYGGGDSQKNFGETSFEQHIQTSAAFNGFQLFSDFPSRFASLFSLVNIVASTGGEKE